MGEKIGYQFEYVFFAVVMIIVFVPIVVMIFRGERIRRWVGTPEMQDGAGVEEQREVNVS
jgi:hypothetical protein